MLEIEGDNKAIKIDEQNEYVLYWHDHMWDCILTCAVSSWDVSGATPMYVGRTKKSIMASGGTASQTTAPQQPEQVVCTPTFVFPATAAFPGKNLFHLQN